MKKTIWLLLLSIIITSGCATNTPQALVEQPKKTNYQLKTLRMQLQDNISTLDPVFAQTKEERQACLLLYDGLIGLDHQTMKPIPGLAQSWNVSEEGKKYTFKLYPKLRFHNGTPIKASDVKFSWERAIYANSPERYIFSDIVGYWEFISGINKEVTGIRAIDDMTLEVTLAVSNKDFLISLANIAASVVDRYQVINKAEAFGKPGTITSASLIPNGSGEFKLYEWNNHGHIIFGINNNYHLDKPKIERLEILLQSKKELNMTDYMIDELDVISEITQGETLANTGLQGKLHTAPLAEVSYLRINPHAMNRALNDARIRKALMLAADFRRIGLYQNSDNLQYLPNNITDYLSKGLTNDKDSVSFNTYAASLLFAEAGYPGGKGLEFNLYYVNNASLKQAALLLKGQWSARGVRVYPQAVSKEQLHSLKKNKTAELYLENWSAPYPSLEAFFYPEFHTAFGRGVSQEMDTLIADAKFTENDASQEQKFKSIEKIVVEQYYIRPLFKATHTVLSKPHISNLSSNKLGILNLSEVTIKY